MEMALSRGLRCCQRVFSWIPVLIITAVVLWSYYAYVFELCLCKCYGLRVCFFFDLFPPQTAQITAEHLNNNKVTGGRGNAEVAFNVRRHSI